MKESVTDFVPVSKATLIGAMRQSAAHFLYSKVDGTTREAYGSLNPDLIEAVMAAKEPSKRTSRRGGPSDEEFISYFDLVKQDWRGFYLENLEGMDMEYSL